MIERLILLYIPALDHRRIDQRHAPYLYGLTKHYPCVRVGSFPEVDLIPSMMTGLYPHEHKMWQVRLKSDDIVNTSSALDYVPDIVTTTSQCFIHMATGSFNLASMPYWRRRRFEIFKTRYFKRELDTHLQINGFDTFFNIIGEKYSNYVFEADLDKVERMLPSLFAKGLRFELTETHGCDTLHHWFLDDEERMVAVYNKIDRYIKLLHSECEKKGAALLILSDHGQEPVKNSIDIIQKINELGIKNNEITYYIEASKVRFWFHSEGAREKMLNYLSESLDGVLLSRRDMYKFNVKFEDDRYGEYYFVLNPGTIFFPNDYYHPLGNLYLGLTNKQMRSRLRSPVYRGYHGYLPNNDSEKGTFIFLNDEYKTDREEISIIDVAPTILDLLGYEQPKPLDGTTAFHI